MSRKILVLVLFLTLAASFVSAQKKIGTETKAQKEQRMKWWTDARFGEERTLAFYKRQYAALPKVNFVGIGDAGHFVMLDQPAAFGAAVEAFVK